MQLFAEPPYELLKKLSIVERVVLAIYRALLGLLLVALVAGTAAVIAIKPWGAGNQGEWFYFTAAVCLAFGWLVTKYLAVRRRQRVLNLPFCFTATSGEGGHTWGFHWGQPPAADQTGESPAGIHLSFSSVAPGPVVELTEDQLPSRSEID